MYEDTTFMKKLHAQLNLVKVKAPTLLSYLNYFQEKWPHVTRVHEKMECLLHFLRLNAAGDEDDFSFCFRGNYKFSCDEKEEIIQVATSAFKAAHSKLSKYVVDGAQPASKFLEQLQVRVINPINLVDCERSLGSIDSIPGMESVSKEEWKLYVDHIGPQAVKKPAIRDGDDTSTMKQIFFLAKVQKQNHSSRNTMKAFHFLNWNLRSEIYPVQEEKEESERVKETL
ncbi:hypothetical protein OS493_029951 [Desmophyllum pertusum]|uniref:Uncharacterized protein n=1 Tax=Desmophyllum pertusum TaxID=174260 RepID=A0A9W9ZXM8_9CNID|nr:hypothetical protein OS493_029951 [Desmophyllum pertusum]